MTDNQSELLGRAISALQLRDIWLFSSSFKRPNPVPESPESEVTLKTKRHVQFVRNDSSPDTDAKQILQVLVELGVRFTGGDEDDAPVFVEIEAEFVAEYAIREDLSDDAVSAFSQMNSVHNVWPFWRQHVFDVVQRGHLPPIQVPLFGGQLAKTEPVTKAIA